MMDIGSRVRRLAPTESPDPERFARARGAVLSAVSGPEGTPRVTDGSVAAGADDDLHDRFEVVVPLPHRARRSRHRVGAAVAVAAACVAAVAGVALWLPLATMDQPAGFDPAAVGERCLEWVQDHATPDQLPAVDGLSLIHATRQGDVEHALVATRLAAGADTVWECTFDGTQTHPGPLGYGATGYTTVPHRQPADRVSWVGGSWGSRAGVSWGYAGGDVTAVRLIPASGEPVDATVVDGYWVVWFTDTLIDDDARMTWSLNDGTRRGPEPLTPRPGD